MSASPSGSDARPGHRAEDATTQDPAAEQAFADNRLAAPCAIDDSAATTVVMPDVVPDARVSEFNLQTHPLASASFYPFAPHQQHLSWPSASASPQQCMAPFVQQHQPYLPLPNPIPMTGAILGATGVTGAVAGAMGGPPVSHQHHYHQQWNSMPHLPGGGGGGMGFQGAGPPLFLSPQQQPPLFSTPPQYLQQQHLHVTPQQLQQQLQVQQQQQLQQQQQQQLQQQQQQQLQ
eukprot:Selendium_serpulae@DN2277_c0_g1_i1.p1